MTEQKISQSVISRQRNTCCLTAEFGSPASCLVKKLFLHRCKMAALIPTHPTHRPSNPHASAWGSAMKMLLGIVTILYLYSSVYRLEALMLICTLQSCRDRGEQW